MSLYKSSQKNPYYFWSVMSNVMQVKCTVYMNVGETLTRSVLFSDIKSHVSCRPDVTYCLSLLGLRL